MSKHSAPRQRRVRAMLRRIIAIAALISLGLIGSVAIGNPASAHTGDLKASAECQPDGTYKVTYTLNLSKVPTENTGATKWRIGNSGFDGTPTSNAGLDRGPVASSGNQTIILGTHTLPGDTKTGPWVYAYTKWSPDNFGKGSDGRVEGLSGDCKKPDVKITAPAPVISPPTCEVDGKVLWPNFENGKWTNITGTGPGTQSATPIADKGYTLTDPSTVTVTVLPRTTGEACANKVTAVSPSVNQSEKCDVQGTYTIPSTEGVNYYLDDKLIKAGTYNGPKTGNISAKPAGDKDVLTNPDFSFSLNVKPAKECPPEEPTEVKVPVGPEHVDPCNPPGVTNNVAWMESLREDTPQIDWSEDIAKGTRTATLKGNTVWDDGTKTPKVFTLPADSGVQCVVPPTPITVPTVPVVDECGIGNAHYGDVPSGNYTVVRNQDGSITLTAKDGYVFPNGQSSITLPKPVEKNTEACPVIAPKASLTSVCEVVDGEKTGYTVVDPVFDNTGSNEEVIFEYVETIDGVTKFYQIPVPAGEKLTPQVLYSQEDGKKVSLVINARDVMQASLSFETATCAATVTPPTPPTKTCPAGTKWIDLNHNGKVDNGECTTPVKPKPPVVKPPVKPVATAPPVVKGPRVETDGGPSGPGSGLLLGLGVAVLAMGFGLRRRTARR